MTAIPCSENLTLNPLIATIAEAIWPALSSPSINEWWKRASTISYPETLKTVIFSRNHGKCLYTDSTRFRRCSFNTEFDRYKIIKYMGPFDSKRTYFNELFEMFRQLNVSESSIEYIKSQISQPKTIHTTFATEARKFLEDRLTKSPFLMEFVIRMFYYDYITFGFDLPEINLT